MRNCFLVLLLAVLTGVGAHAQRTVAPAPEAPAAPPPAPADSNLPPVGAGYLVERYGLTLDEAARRLRLQDEISALVSQVKRAGDPEFGAIWVQHQPVFRINISYTNPDDRKLLQLRIDPKIRQYVKLMKANRSARIAQADAERIFAEVRAAGSGISLARLMKKPAM